MELTSRLKVMDWLVRQGLSGAAANDLLRGFCERCRAEGLELSRGLAFIAATELWDRISFHGMQALLVLYMVNRLLLPGHVEHVAGFAAFALANYP